MIIHDLLLARFAGMFYDGPGFSIRHQHLLCHSLERSTFIAAIVNGVFIILDCSIYNWYNQQPATRLPGNQQPATGYIATLLTAYPATGNQQSCYPATRPTGYPATRQPCLTAFAPYHSAVQGSDTTTAGPCTTVCYQHHTIPAPAFLPVTKDEFP